MGKDGLREGPPRTARVYAPAVRKTGIEGKDLESRNLQPKGVSPSITARVTPGEERSRTLAFDGKNRFSLLEPA